MIIRKYKKANYITIPQAYIQMLRIKRFDQISLVPHRYSLSGDNYHENHLQMLILIDKKKQFSRQYNPERRNCRISISQDIMSLMGWKIGESITGVIQAINDDYSIIAITETRQISDDIPDFLNIDINSLKKRLNISKKPKKAIKPQKNGKKTPHPHLIDDEMIAKLYIELKDDEIFDNISEIELISDTRGIK